MTLQQTDRPRAWDSDEDQDGPDTPPTVGQTELGRVDVDARAVEKIAAIAAAEIPDAGGPGVRGLSRLPGAGHLGMRPAGLDRLPKVSADVDGKLVFLDVQLAVRWPAPVATVAEAVRQHLFSKLGDLVGLEVREVNIDVVDLVTEVAAARVS